MPTYTLEMAAASVAWGCIFKHDFGCGCWERSPEAVASRKERIRGRLGRESVRPLP